MSVKAIKEFLEKSPLLSIIILFVTSFVLFIQCAMTLTHISSKKPVGAARTKRLRDITIVTLLVSLFLVLYAIVKIVCNYSPLKLNPLCMMGKVL